MKILVIYCLLCWAVFTLATIYYWWINWQFRKANESHLSVDEFVIGVNGKDSFLATLFMMLLSPIFIPVCIIMICIFALPDLLKKKPW